MGNLFKSSQKQTSVSSAAIPSNFQSLMNRTLGMTNTALDQPFQGYGAPRISPLSANEQQGVTAAGANAGMYQPLIDMAMTNNASMQAQGGLPGAGDVEGLINPYIDYVLRNSLDRLQEQSDTNMTKIGSMAGMSGAFGGSRHGVLEGANLAELLKSARDLSGSTYADAYDKGMSNWFRGQDLRRGGIQDALGIARGGQDYNTQDINNLMGTGLTERTRNQGLLDFAFSEFMREQQDPYTKAGFSSGIMQSYPTDLFTRTNVTTNTNTPSPFSQIAGVGLAAAGLATGNPAALAGLGAGAASLGGGMSGSGMPLNAPMRQSPWKKGGLVKSYKKGGKVQKKDEIKTLMNKLGYGEDAQYKIKRPYQILPDMYSDNSILPPMSDVTLETPPDVTDPFFRLPADIYDTLAPLFEAGRDKPLLPETRMDASSLAPERRTHYFTKNVDRWLNQTKQERADTLKRLQGIKVSKDPLSPEALEAMQNLLDEKFNTVPQEEGFAFGGSVAGTIGDLMGGFSLAGQAAQHGTGAIGILSRLFGDKKKRPSFLGFDQEGEEPMQEPGQRQPFDWGSFMQRYGISNMGNPVAPMRQMSARPDLSGFMDQLNLRTQGSAQGSPRGLRGGGYVKGYANGGEATRDPLDMVPHDGSSEDMLAAQDFWDLVKTGFAPTDEGFSDTTVSARDLIDPTRVGRLAIQAHETNTPYDQPDYKSNPYLGKYKEFNSHAFGVYQWQPDTWNEEVMLWNKNHPKDQVKFVTAAQIEANRLPSKAEQDKISKVREKRIQASGGGDWGRAFAVQQLGAGDYQEALNAFKKDPNTKMRNVSFKGDKPARVARNVSSYYVKDGKVKRDETVGQYFNRLDGMIKDADTWEFDRLRQQGFNPTEKIQGYPSEEGALAFRLPKKKNKPSDAEVDKIMARSRLTEPSRPIADLVYPSREGNDIGMGISELYKPLVARTPMRGENPKELLSPLEIILGGKQPEPPKEDYLNSRISQGGRKVFSGGGKVNKKYAHGDLVKFGPGSDPNQMVEFNQGAPTFMDWLSDKLSGDPFDKMKQRQDNERVILPLNQGNKPLNQVDLNPYQPPEDPNDPFGGDLVSIIPGASQGTTVDDFTNGLETGNMDGVAKNTVRRETNSRNEELQSALDDLMMERIQALKNESEPDTDPLRGIFGDYNKGLFKMGMNILANSNYPNSGLEALAKGVLGTQQSEEQDMLAKNERKNKRLKDLLNARYMQSMIENMSPDSRAQVANIKGQYDVAIQMMKSQAAALKERNDEASKMKLKQLEILIEQMKQGQGITPQQNQWYQRNMPGSVPFTVDESGIEELE